MQYGDMYCWQYSQDAFGIKHFVDICRARRDKPRKLHMFIAIHYIFNTWRDKVKQMIVNLLNFDLFETLYILTMNKKEIKQAYGKSDEQCST